MAHTTEREWERAENNNGMNENEKNRIGNGECELRVKHSRNNNNKAHRTHFRGSEWTREHNTIHSSIDTQRLGTNTHTHTFTHKTRTHTCATCGLFKRTSSILHTVSNATPHSVWCVCVCAFAYMEYRERKIMKIGYRSQRNCFLPNVVFSWRLTVIRSASQYNLECVVRTHHQSRRLATPRKKSELYRVFCTVFLSIPQGLEYTAHPLFCLFFSVCLFVYSFIWGIYRIYILSTISFARSLHIHFIQ